MKTLTRLFNDLTWFNMTNIKLINCVLTASLLISTPTYALDGEGWGAIIKGVTEVLHENQQLEIKQREEQQRLQEQQAEKLRQQNLQQANNMASGQNCGHIINSKINTIKKWTGGCSGGKLFGEGELTLSSQNQNWGLTKYVAKFKDGFFTGVYIAHILEQNNQIAPIQYTGLKYVENLETYSIPLTVETNNRLQSYTYKDFDWYTTTADFSKTDKKVSFEEAMQIVKNYMATKSADTMSYERFRAYLEGKLSFDPLVTQQTNNSPSNESASEATDEPPQKGIFLDRRKKTKPKTKI